MKAPTAIACFYCALGCIVLAVPNPVVAAKPTLEWIEQLGTSENEGSRGVSVDGLGNVYMTGSTIGNLGGTNLGGSDAFVSKYDANGSLLWTEQLGTSRNDRGFSVSADGLGNVYVSGQIHEGHAFVGKYDAGGSLLWTEQLAWGDQNLPGIAWDVSTDKLGNVFFSGNIPRQGYLGFLSKFDASGNQLWIELLRTNGSDGSSSASTDGLGNVYITGWTEGSLGGPHVGHYDAFAMKYDTNGNLLWSKQLGSLNADFGYGASADGLGNVYISGHTRGNLGGDNAGKSDAFVSKYDANGSLLWTEQLGTSDSDESFSVSADGLGNVYISGKTKGSLGGPNAGGNDTFVSKYDDDGNLLWTEQLGTSGEDVSQSVSADGLGNVYISGTTGGSLGGPHLGGNDAFLAKFSDSIPEPSTLLLSVMVTVGLAYRRCVASRLTPPPSPSTL